MRDTFVLAATELLTWLDKHLPAPGEVPGGIDPSKIPGRSRRTISRADSGVENTGFGEMVQRLVRSGVAAWNSLSDPQRNGLETVLNLMGHDGRESIRKLRVQLRTCAERLQDPVWPAYPSKHSLDGLLRDAAYLRIALRLIAPPSKEPREKKGGRRRRKRSAAVRALTELQRQALELYGEHNGKVAAIAQAMGISRATASQHLHAAWRKLPSAAPKPRTLAGKTRRLPTDRRGQAVIPDEE